MLGVQISAKAGDKMVEPEPLGLNPCSGFGYALSGHETLAKNREFPQAEVRDTNSTRLNSYRVLQQ